MYQRIKIKERYMASKEAERSVRNLQVGHGEQRRDEHIMNDALATIVHRSSQVGKTVPEFAVTISTRLSLAELKTLSYKLRVHHRLIVQGYAVGERWRQSTDSPIYT